MIDAIGVSETVVTLFFWGITRFNLFGSCFRDTHRTDHALPTDFYVPIHP